ncbi:hypothetical protein UFOVP783_41 [uncultured Caudovirales phage]|uniref:Uncharacterized protein n=1 Tax=uncultured Caudovirales phage TaxID=2100421 RepID=A0A6J5NZP6_9CAUD|nr:hypothetical protein UFOVP783_41 [uncultured Caudovirales phage]
MNTPVPTITLDEITLPDGCWTVNTAPVVAAAVAAARPPKEREGFPRFSLKVDGRWLRTARAETLAQWVSAIRPGAKYRVFRNGGKGATIDFDV